VYIHHKFILIDAATDHPIIYTGSVNRSNNSNYTNDENLLKKKNEPAIARLYLTEFMRLYEHYRARVQFKNNSEGRTGKGTLKLAGDHRWSIDDYTPGTPQYKSRITMAY